LKKKYLALSILLIVVSIILAGVSLTGSMQGSYTGKVSAKALINTGSDMIEKTIEIENATAFDILEQSFEIEYDEYAGMGKFITSVNGISSDEENYWIFFVNDESADVGVDNYIVQQNDLIEMRFMTSEDAMGIFK